MSLFHELQRRKVIRTTLAYGAAAFVAAQVVQLLVDALGLPAWILRAVVVVAIGALPIVIALAWAFDASREGVSVTPAATDGRAVRVRWQKLAVPFVASVVLVAGAFFALRDGADATLSPDLVAVLPFHVAGDPQISYLHEGMVDLLAAKLTGEGGPRAADPRAVMSVVREHEGDLSDTKAVEIARAVGSGRVLIGSVVGTPAEFTIHAKILRVPGGRLLAEAEQSGRADSLLVTIDRLVAKLLSLQAGEGSSRLEQLTTTSLPALRAYLDGRVAYRSGHFGKASELYAKAIDIDSTFALAGIGLFMTGGWGEGPAIDGEKMRRSIVGHRDRLGKVDRAIAVAIYGDDPTKHRSHKQRLADWEAIVTLAPDNLDAQFWYADFVFHWGAVTDMANATEIADETFSRILKADSTYVPALLHRIDVAMRDDRVDVMRELEPVRKRLDPHETAAGYQRSRRIRMLGDSAAIAAERAALDTMSVDALRLAETGWGAAPGSIDDGRRALELRLKKASTQRDRLDALWGGIDRFLMSGMPKRAQELTMQLREVRPLDAPAMQMWAALYWDGDAAGGAAGAAEVGQHLTTAESMEDRVWMRCMLTQWQLWHGDTTSYAAMKRELAAVPADSAQLRAVADVCAGANAVVRATVLKAPDLKQQIAAFDAIMREGPRVPSFILNTSNIVLGRAAEQAGDKKLALRAYSRQPGGSLESIEFVTTMMREEARLAAQLGERERAIRKYRKYLLLHEQAEPAIQKIDDAVRRDLARLSGESR